mmetsp:Transcript_20744/g.41499  ORF Transcript_20744/g.41499 Transcript_20744/m.41499 type:complete len:263 (+) Transcript_20744:883-1671(+)
MCNRPWNPMRRPGPRWASPDPSEALPPFPVEARDTSRPVSFSAMRSTATTSWSKASRSTEWTVAYRTDLGREDSVSAGVPSRDGTMRRKDFMASTSAGEAERDARSPVRVNIVPGVAWRGSRMPSTMYAIIPSPATFVLIRAGVTTPTSCTLYSCTFCPCPPNDDGSCNRSHETIRSPSDNIPDSTCTRQTTPPLAGSTNESTTRVLRNTPPTTSPSPPPSQLLPGAGTASAIASNTNSTPSPVLALVGIHESGSIPVAALA